MVPNRPTPSRASRLFDAVVAAGGLAVAVTAVLAVVAGAPTTWQIVATSAVAAVLIPCLGRFEVSLHTSLPSSNEPFVTFESAVLVFLICTVPLRLALLAWVVGQLATSLLEKLSTPVRLFNFGLLVTSGAAGLGLVWALGGVPLDAALSDGQTVTAVTAGCLTYVALMYGVLMTSVALESRIPLRSAISVRQTLHALGALIAIESLGFLAALIRTSLPWWSLVLLAGPILGVLATSQALSRAREHRQRLTALFEATKQIQLSATHDEIIGVVRDRAPKIVGTGGTQLRAEPPTGHEFGAQVRNAREPLWVVATGLNRAPQRRSADQEALEALTTVVEEALLRTSLAAEMNRMAHYDALTGLPNRVLFFRSVEAALSSARGSADAVAVLFIDLDGFKTVNDRHGHGAGDQLLAEVAARLGATVREGDLVARLGGDEFAVLVEAVPSVEHLVRLAERIIATLATAVPSATDGGCLGASVGIATAVLRWSLRGHRQLTEAAPHPAALPHSRDACTAPSGQRMPRSANAACTERAAPAP